MVQQSITSTMAENCPCHLPIVWYRSVLDKNDLKLLEMNIAALLPAARNIHPGWQQPPACFCSLQLHLMCVCGERTTTGTLEI